MTTEREGPITIGVERVTEHEDGGATYHFTMDHAATQAMAQIGLETVMLCATYGVDLQDALGSVRRASSAPRGVTTPLMLYQALREAVHGRNGYVEPNPRDLRCVTVDAWFDLHEVAERLSGAARRASAEGGEEGA